MPTDDHKDKFLPDFHEKVNFKTGFHVPDGYFNTFPDKMVAILEDELNRTTKKPSLLSRLMDYFNALNTVPKMAISLASFLLILAVGYYNYTQAPAQDVFAMNAQDALDYIMEHQDELELEDLYALDFDEANINMLTSEESELYLEDVLDEIDEELLDEIVM